MVYFSSEEKLVSEFLSVPWKRGGIHRGKEVAPERREVT